MRILDSREPDVTIEMSEREWMMFDPRGGLIIESPDPKDPLAIWLTPTGHLVLIIRREEEEVRQGEEKMEAEKRKGV